MTTTKIDVGARTIMVAFSGRATYPALPLAGVQVKKRRLPLAGVALQPFGHFG